MYKIVAILCVLVWPDDTMDSQLQCTRHYESVHRSFTSLTVCEQEALAKQQTTIKGFAEWRVDYESFTVYCEKQ